MVKIPKRCADPFLTPKQVENDDLATIINVSVQNAEDSTFHKERTILNIILKRTGNAFRWGINNTSSDRLVKAYGEDADLWRNKQVKIQKRTEVVRGEDKDVLYALPYIEPTKQTEITEKKPQENLVMDIS